MTYWVIWDGRDGTPDDRYFKKLEDAERFFEGIKVPYKTLQLEGIVNGEYIDKVLREELEEGWMDAECDSDCEYDERDSDWRPGDAPWNAPGMSVRDFI